MPRMTPTKIMAGSTTSKANAELPRRVVRILACRMHILAILSMEPMQMSVVRIMVTHAGMASPDCEEVYVPSLWDYLEYGT